MCVFPLLLPAVDARCCGIQCFWFMSANVPQPHPNPCTLLPVYAVYVLCRCSCPPMWVSVLCQRKGMLPSATAPWVVPAPPGTVAGQAGGIPGPIEQQQRPILREMPVQQRQPFWSTSTSTSPPPEAQVTCGFRAHQYRFLAPPPYPHRHETRPVRGLPILRVCVIAVDVPCCGTIGACQPMYAYLNGSRRKECRWWSYDLVARVLSCECDVRMTGHASISDCTVRCAGP